MKNLMNFFKFSLFAMIFVTMVSCGEDTPAPTDEELQKAATDALVAAGTAAVSGTPTGPAGSESLDWTGFTLKFNNGTYTVSGVPAGGEPVWPAGGTWAWADATTTTKMARGDGASMNLTLTETTLDINLTGVTDGSGRVVEGDWEFSFGL